MANELMAVHIDVASLLIKGKFFLVSAEIFTSAMTHAQESKIVDAVDVKVARQQRVEISGRQLLLVELLIDATR